MKPSILNDDFSEEIDRKSSADMRSTKPNKWTFDFILHYQSEKEECWTELLTEICWTEMLHRIVTGNKT